MTSSRLHPVSGPMGLVVALGWANDWDSLDGLTGPVDPNFLLSLPKTLRPRDFALTVGIMAHLTTGRTSSSAKAMARVLGCRSGELEKTVGRVDLWVPTVNVSLNGDTLNFSVDAKRRLRPDLYVRLRVDTLASAPSPVHARFYVLSAQAIIGNDLSGTNRISASRERLGMSEYADLDFMAEGLIDWVKEVSQENVRAWRLAAAAADDEIQILATNSCCWEYDHRSAPRPWMGKDDDKTFRKSVLDGEWEGKSLTVAYMRLAKVCHWVNRLGCEVSADEFTRRWLILLNKAFHGKSVNDALSGQKLLEVVRVEGVDRAFELFVLEEATRLRDGLLNRRWVTESAALTADEARVLRRMRMQNPDDERTHIHATCAETGETFTKMQFTRLLAQKFSKMRENGAGKKDFAQAWKRIREDYLGEKPVRVAAPIATVFINVNAVGAELMLDMDDSDQTTLSLYTAAIDAVSMMRGIRMATTEELISEAVDRLRFGDLSSPDDAVRPETMKWLSLSRQWGRANGAAHQAFSRQIIDLIHQTVASTSPRSIAA